MPTRIGAKEADIGVHAADRDEYVDNTFIGHVSFATAQRTSQRYSTSSIERDGHR
jgi:hypothetical protein